MPAKIARYNIAGMACSYDKKKQLTGLSRLKTPRLPAGPRDKKTVPWGHSPPG